MPRAALLCTGLIPALAGCVSVLPGAPSRYTPPPGSAAYELPLGGDDTISLSKTDCVDGCPVVSVLLDPDDYWQRSAPDSAYSGIGREGFYDSVAMIFEAEGFYDREHPVDILKDNPDTCPQYLEPGEVYFINLARAGIGHRINYDSACTGSAEALRAQNATEALAGLPDLTHIFEGTVTLRAPPAETE